MRLILILLVALAAGCGEKVAPEPRPGDVHHLPPIEWRIVDRDTLRSVYRGSGMALGEKDQLHGFVGTQEGHWVIYTLPPARINDQPTCTLGHEVMHVALGDYHR